MTRAFTRQKPLSKTSLKAAAKAAEYDAAPKNGAIAPRSGVKPSQPRWMKRMWDAERGVVVSRPSAEYHREGSIDDLEARENAGQLKLL
ncbi:MULTISPECIES: hypothetical protein [unclassified Rhizobium]|uniref:hypothetical protein n=1 Tax=unclassified Rhizobium TaxID=2613769 RepID=UPI00071543C7|nr:MULTISPECIES: hypothetical protein [unclassified Rhizobium]KQS83961.1 hypothetical protein ASG58_21590 [Rhizobium sp. Leaf383]